MFMYDENMGKNTRREVMLERGMKVRRLVLDKKAQEKEVY